MSESLKFVSPPGSFLLWFIGLCSLIGAAWCGAQIFAAVARGVKPDDLVVLMLEALCVAVFLLASALAIGLELLATSLRLRKPPVVDAPPLLLPSYLDTQGETRDDKND